MTLSSKRYLKYPKGTKAKDARVAVAKDVIGQIELGKLKARRGEGYLTSGGGYIWSDVPCSLSGIQKICTMCARGALVLSAFNLYDGDFGAIVNDRGITQEETRIQLEGIFSHRELSLIETAFEKIFMDGVDTFHSSRRCLSAIKFGNAIPDDADRLLAIMQNIVDNGGTFKPEIEYEITSG